MQMKEWIERHIPGIAWNGDEGSGRCPLHDDRNPSLSVNVAKGVYYCHGGCDGGTLRQLAERAGWDWPFADKQEVARYRYRNAHGLVVYEVVRFEPKTFRLYCPTTEEWSAKGVQRVPYRLPELIQGINEERRIFVVEGEKDVEALSELSFLATCNPGGTGGRSLWKDFAQYFQRGTRVFLIPDADQPGQELMREVARRLSARGCEVKWLDLGYPITADHGKDVSDWIAEGHTRRELVELANAAPSRGVAEKDNTDVTTDGAATTDRSRPSVATVVVECLQSTGAELFHQGKDDAYCTFPVGAHAETSRIRAKLFKEYLRKLYYDSAGRVANTQGLEDALGLLEAKAKYEGLDCPVYVRYAPDGSGGLFVDLGDESWRAVHVRNGEWEVVPNAPVRFIRPTGQLALPVPEPGGSIEELHEFWNVTEEQFRLMVVFVLQAMRHKGPYAALEIDGVAGSGKSSHVKTIKDMVDPNTAPLRTAPKYEVDLIIAARGSQLPCFDNISYLDTDLSDALCRIATGGGLGKRTLYTDFDETIVWVERPFILNGINPIASRGDLVDRLFRISLATHRGREAQGG